MVMQSNGNPSRCFSVFNENKSNEKWSIEMLGATYFSNKVFDISQPRLKN